MDYTLNYLAKDIQCTGDALRESFESVKFGMVDDVEVFDATECCALSEIEPVDYKVFSRVNKRYIETLIDAGMADRKELFYMNPNGHLLINSCLTIIYLAFIDKDIFLYFWSMLNEVVYNGIALSDSFLANLVMNRIPNHTLEEIIKIRNNDEANATNGIQ